MKILFSEGSSTSARQNLFVLGPMGHEIHVCDPQLFGLGRFSRYVKRWHRCAAMSADPQGYLRFVAGRLREEKYDVLFPVHDQAYLFSRFRDPLSKLAGLAVPDFDAMETAQSKISFFRLLEELKLPQPEAEIVPNFEHLDRDWKYPCFVKLPHSTAGRGVWRVKDRDELDAVIADLRSLGDAARDLQILIQQPCGGKFRVVQTVFRHGELMGLHIHETRAHGAGGAPYARLSVLDPIVREHLSKLGRHLNWHGGMHIEYFSDPDSGRPRYIECNPRIGETVSATLSGVNLCQMLLDVSTSRDVDPLPPGKEGVLTHAVITGVLGVAERGEGRRRIVRELWQAWRGKGVYQGGIDELSRCKEDHRSMIPTIAIALQVLACPPLSKRIIQGAVDNYGLNTAAVERIREMPLDALDESIVADKRRRREA